ncbi:protein NRT1/ PTR FAMILY 3.1-like [Panicum virgatum]|uniref:protein NRT1/ PTR FAMILY 3.1-like n=1 Tax=Panicum virgatum TaxID=38727 RepID=UPI0019D67E96|nr:protein NRT1/ PTR FAMILY 3.1-like [Panicum virgatum]
MSVFWLVPQYAIHGVADAFMDVGRMEFLYDQAPESLRSTAAALYWLTCCSDASVAYSFPYMTNSMGSYLGTLLVLNLVYYFLCVRYYTFKRLETVGDDKEVELDHVNNVSGNCNDDTKKGAKASFR